MLKAVALVLALVVVAGCGASRSYRRGQQAANAQQFDEAVEHYRQALQGAPDKPEYKIALERAMQAAGAGATAQRPLAWVTVETNRATFRHELRCRYWPGGGGDWHLLGEAHAHGAWVEWHA